MSWLIFHIASGHSFFSGIVLFIVAAIASISLLKVPSSETSDDTPASARSRPLLKRVVALSFFLGGIAVVLSSTAIPYWLYAVAVIVTLWWIASSFQTRWRRSSAYATLIVWLIAALVELPYHLLPTVNRVDDRNLTVIGDSVTAGLDAAETSETWPAILAREQQLQIQDISRMGETAASALKQVKSQPIKSKVVLIEIGGNDLLGSTSSQQFRKDLDALLSYVEAKDRQIVMLELPLPPFCHEYGRVQREVAAKHHVLLVPKRIFLSVLTDGNATLDSVHLSQGGHQLMAESVWQVIKTAY